MTGEALDGDARLKLLEAISEMPEGVDIVKWLYLLLVKSMLCTNTHTNTNKHTIYTSTNAFIISPLAVQLHH